MPSRALSRPLCLRGLRLPRGLWLWLRGPARRARLPDGKGAIDVCADGACKHCVVFTIC